MPAKKQYTDPSKYEEKLERVMERLGVEDYSFDYSRRESWICFKYKGQSYRFEQSLDNAKAHGLVLNYGSDAFSQLVLTLEDLARMVERGIYDLQTWVVGMRALPEHSLLPSCFLILGFDRMPETQDEIKRQYHKLLMQAHPDHGGTAEAFQQVNLAYKEALKSYSDI